MNNDPLAEKIRGHYQEISADHLRHRMASRSRRNTLVGAGAAMAVAASLVLLSLPRELSAQQIMDQAAKSLREVGTLRTEIMHRHDGRTWKSNFLIYSSPEQQLVIMAKGHEAEQWALTKGGVRYSWVKFTGAVRKAPAGDVALDFGGASIFDMVKSDYVDVYGAGLHGPDSGRKLASKKSIRLPDGREGYELVYTAEARDYDRETGRATKPNGHWSYWLVVERVTMLPQSLTMTRSGSPGYAMRVVFSYGHDFNGIVAQFPDTSNALDVTAIRDRLKKQAEAAKKVRPTITAAWRTPHDLVYIARHAPGPKQIVDDQGRTWVHIRPFPADGGPESALYVCETGRFEPDATFEGLRPLWQGEPETWPVEALAFDVGMQLWEAPSSAEYVRKFWLNKQKPPSE